MSVTSAPRSPGSPGSEITSTAQESRSQSGGKSLIFNKHSSTTILDVELNKCEMTALYVKAGNAGLLKNIVNIKLAKLIKALCQLWAEFVGSINARNVVIIGRGLGSYLGFGIVLKLVADIFRTAQVFLIRATNGILRKASSKEARKDPKPLPSLTSFDKNGFAREVTSEYVGDIADFFLIFNPAAIPLKVVSAFSHILYGAFDITDAVNCWMKTDINQSNALKKRIALEKVRFHMFNVAKAVFSIVSSFFGLGLALHAAGKLDKVAPALMRLVPGFARRTVTKIILNAQKWKLASSVCSAVFGMFGKAYQLFNTEALNNAFKDSYAARKMKEEQVGIGKVREKARNAFHPVIASA